MESWVECRVECRVECQNNEFPLFTWGLNDLGGVLAQKPFVLVAEACPGVVRWPVAMSKNGSRAWQERRSSAARTLIVASDITLYLRIKRLVFGERIMGDRTPSTTWKGSTFRGRERL